MVHIIIKKDRGLRAHPGLLLQGQIVRVFFPITLGFIVVQSGYGQLFMLLLIVLCNFFGAAFAIQERI